MRTTTEKTTTNMLPTHAETVIVGSGFGGLAAAVALQKAGREFVILERAAELGGTWRDNSYPGCACDVPSHLYSFSFALNPNWSRSFSGQSEIFGYLRDTARRYGIDDHIVFDAEVLDARWDDVEQLWRIESAAGPVTARFLIGATGGLSEPSVPELPGLERFRGATFHSARWDHSHDLTGKRVAVIGTGASAIQFVPHVQRAAERLTVVQRTAPWVLPRRDRDIGRAERWVYRHVPFTQRIVRSLIYWGRETWVMGFRKPRIMRFPERQARDYIAKQISDPELRAKVTPGYTLGCKRVLLSNDYYPALDQPNVDLVTDRLVEVTEDAVVTEDAQGKRTSRPVDTIIFGTGFKVTNPPIAERIYGLGGRSLRDRWAGGMSALYGLTVTGFPNLFFLTGPNTGLGHNSIVLMLEAQVSYTMKLLRAMERAGAATVEPRADVQQHYNTGVQRSLKDTVWNAGGCASWYLDATGRNTTLWPSFTFSYMAKLRNCDLTDYILRPPKRVHLEQESTAIVIPDGLGAGDGRVRA